MMNNEMRPLRERKQLQEEYGIHTLPLRDLCYCTYTRSDGETFICDVLCTNESEKTAILHYLNRTTGKRWIWVAKRDQNGTSGTWLWTPAQLEAAKKNPTRIDDLENDFRGGEASEQIQVAPIHRDRRVEILMLGLTLGKSDAEVQERLRAAGLDDTLPENYRTEQGEIDLLKNWLPE